MANQESLIIKDSSGTEADVTVANALKVDGSAVTQPVSGTVTVTPSGTQNVDVTGNSIGLSTGAKQDLLLAELQLKADLTETQPVSAASLPLPSGAATSALQQNDALTDVELRATPVPVSMASASVLFKGRAATFRTPGRAGTTGQNILAIHNATGSAVTVTVSKIVVDIYQTVVKAITVAPPNIRIWKVTVLPTNGTALAKTKIGGTTTSSGSVTVFGDASADGTGSGTTLTTTRPAGTFIAQRFASRNITAAGYEMIDGIEFLDSTDVILNPLEGLVVFLDYTLATQNPVTDMWAAYVEWTEN